MEIEARFEDRAGHQVITRLVIEADVIDTALLRKLPLHQLESRANLAQDHRPTCIRWNEDEAATQPVPPQLSRPDGTDPEGHAQLVAQAYREVAQTSHRPAAVLAEEAGVPVTTVHRWIREARQRGFLPPARRGRAG